jgi:hypothetical protein
LNFIGAGRALTIAGNTPQEYHLWLILTDPDPESGKVITVMVVSPKKHTDPTVLLVSGEHPFLKHDSHVDYGSAQLKPAVKLAEAWRMVAHTCGMT